MSDLRDLYQDVILDHNRRPRNFGPLEGANREAEGYNPLCGDRVTVRLSVADDGTIQDIHFEGYGCAISTASASLMTESLKGKTVEEAEALFQRFHCLVTSDLSAALNGGSKLGKLRVLLGVRQYPTRVKCATLAWHTMHAALKNRRETVTTE